MPSTISVLRRPCHCSKSRNWRGLRRSRRIPHHALRNRKSILPAPRNARLPPSLRHRPISTGRYPHAHTRRDVLSVAWSHIFSAKPTNQSRLLAGKTLRLKDKDLCGRCAVGEWLDVAVLLEVIAGRDGLDDQAVVAQRHGQIKSSSDLFSSLTESCQRK